MLDLSILKKYGTTNKRLREVLTAGRPGQVPAIPANETKEQEAERVKLSNQINLDIAYRQNLEAEARARIDAGVTYSLHNYQFYAAADLAWDSAPVNKYTLPLILYAQGKVDVQTCAKSLSGVRGGSEFIKKDPQGKPESIDLPRFFECNINLCRSFTTRRVSAQANKFANLYPHYKYESRSTGLVGKMRADVLSQRVEMMTDQFGYRHHDVQCMRDAFLYAHCVDFVAVPWDVHMQWVKKEVAEDLASDTKFEVEAEVQKEGVIFENIHPSKVFWDNNYPLSSINTDTGCEYIGYWNVQRYRDVKDNAAFFNTDNIGYTSNLWGSAGLFVNFKSYFDQFSTTLKPPQMPEMMANDPAALNDRKANVGIYSGDLLDTSILTAVYCKRLVPKDYGIGDYPFPIWVRFVVASDSTLVFAEILPSTPAAYLGINESDARLVNISMMHELMGYQDQLTNLFTEMLLIVQQELLKIFAINTDAVENPANLEAIRNRLQGNSWGSGKPIVFEYSLKKLSELGLNIKEVVSVTETRAAQSLTAIFEAITRLIDMAEKLMAMSPAEQGQPAPREISATEVTEIASTTSSVYSFISMGVDEFRAAKKKILYESLVSMGKGDVYCPVQERYTEDTIKKAGFTVDGDEKEDFHSPLGIQRHTVIGSVRKLIHEYIFSSRDGDERAVSTQAANTLVQLLGQFISNPTILAAMGKEKLYEIVNEIFRMSGAGIDLNLTLKPGEDNSLGEDQVKGLQQQMEQFAKVIQQMGPMIQKNSQDIQQRGQQIDSVEAHMPALVQIGNEVQKLVASNAQQAQKAKESISINYKDAPPSIRAQMEQAAGFQPAPEAEHLAVATTP